MYGYDYMKKIVLRHVDLNEHVIAERDFKYLYPSDFEDLYLLNLQGHLNHLPPKDKKILTTTVNQWTRQLVIPQCVEDFQLGIESYQTQLNLTKPQWDATGFEYKHGNTVVDSPRAVIFRDKYGVQMMMRFNEIYKFNNETLQQIDEALDYRVKEFRINRMNPGLNTRMVANLTIIIWMKCADLVRRSTMTQIMSCPLDVLGSFVTKSIVILSHFHVGISGCIRRTSNALSIPRKFSALMFSSLIASVWDSRICDGNFGCRNITNALTRSGLICSFRLKASVDQIVPAFLKELICKVLGLLVPLLELNRFGILLSELVKGRVVSSVIGGILSIEARDMDTKLLSAPKLNNTLAKYWFKRNVPVTTFGSWTLHCQVSRLKQGGSLDQELKKKGANHWKQPATSVSNLSCLWRERALQKPVPKDTQQCPWKSILAKGQERSPRPECSHGARSCMMQGSSFTHGKAFSIPIVFSWRYSISLDGFLPSILLLVVIIVAVAIVVITFILVVVVGEGSSIIKLPFVIIGNPPMKTSTSFSEFGIIVGYKIANS
nr:hypothetical protein [Tanacetum cinerariifolium]